MLRELLRALHLGRLGIRSEDRDASCTHSVADALDEGRLRADHDEADSVLFRECCHRLRRFRIELCLLGQIVHAAIARRHVDLAGTRRLGKLHEQRMLAAACAQQKNRDLVFSHVGPPSKDRRCRLRMSPAPSLLA